MSDTQARQEEINQNAAKFFLMFSELGGMGDDLAKALNDLRDDLDVSQVLTLKNEIAELESQFEDTQHRARELGKKVGKDEDLIAAISAEYCEFEWIFDYCDLD